MKFLLPFLCRFIVDPFTETVRQRVVRVIKELKTEPVLVVCAGNGTQCLDIIKSNFLCYGIDISFNSVSYAQSRCRRQINICGDAGLLPYRNGFFKAVVFTYALHDKSELLRSKMIKESLRILNKNGVLIITDIDTPFNFLTKLYSGVTFLIELLSGHFNNGMQFIKCGGLSSIIKGENLEIIKRKNNLYRNAAMIVVKRGSLNDDFFIH